MRINNGLLYSLLLASLAITQHAFAADYAFTDLGTLGDQSSVATDINNNGQIIGISFTSDNYTFSGQPFIYSNSNMQKLGNFDGYFSAISINDNGLVVGQLMNLSLPGPARASLYSNGSLQDLGALDGVTSAAIDINDTGLIVGFSVASNGVTAAFLYSNDTMQDIGSLGGTVTFASSINNSGQIVGESYTSDPNPNVYPYVYEDNRRAFLYSNGNMQNLGTLVGDTFSAAYSINDNGLVVGQSGKSEFDTRAFLYTNGAMQDLGNLGGSLAIASSINNNGLVVGRSSISEDTTNTRAFLYTNGSMHDLNSFLDITTKEAGWTLNSAEAINDNGLIVGYATNTNFFGSRAFLLSPVPEPETYAMLLAGLGLLGVVARRKKIVYNLRAKKMLCKPHRYWLAEHLF